MYLVCVCVCVCMSVTYIILHVVFLFVCVCVVLYMHVGFALLYVSHDLSKVGRNSEVLHISSHNDHSCCGLLQLND